MYIKTTLFGKNNVIYINMDMVSRFVCTDDGHLKVYYADGGYDTTGMSFEYFENEILPKFIFNG